MWSISWGGGEWGADEKGTEGTRRCRSIAQARGVVELLRMQCGRGASPASEAVISAPCKTLIRLIKRMS